MQYNFINHQESSDDRYCTYIMATEIINIANAN